MTEEWGPWIEHDGKGCPCVGQYVEREKRNGQITAGIADMQTFSADGQLLPFDPKAPNRWRWDEVSGPLQIIRYRIRKPRALLQLIELVENLPAPQGVQA